MKKLFRPYSFALYLLTFLLFLFLGAYISGKVGAADGQGLAGGAIVLFNGVITGFVAFVAALFFAYYAPRKVIIWTNVIMLVLLLGAFLMARLQYMEKHKDDVPYEPPQHRTPTAPAQDAQPIDGDP